MGIFGGILKEVLAPVTDVISEVVVDKDKKNELNYKIQELIDRADQRYHDELLGQIEINKEEAKHASVFVAGWRPFIGWVSGASLAYTFVLSPFIEFFARLLGYTGVMPLPDTSSLMTLITAMLGVGAMRSFDKLKGTAALPKASPGAS